MPAQGEKSKVVLVFAFKKKWGSPFFQTSLMVSVFYKVPQMPCVWEQWHYAWGPSHALLSSQVTLDRESLKWLAGTQLGCN